MNETTTQLLTLLNVSALKRKRPIVDPTASSKLNKRKKTVIIADAEPNALENPANDVQAQKPDTQIEEEDRHSEVDDGERDAEGIIPQSI